MARSRALYIHVKYDNRNNNRQHLVCHVTERPFVKFVILNVKEQLYCGHKSSRNVSRREREKEMRMRYCMRNVEVLGNLGATRSFAFKIG